MIDVLENIIIYIAYQEEKHYTDAFRRLAIHYQNGAKKYNKNNWRKGQPISRYYDSAIRHAWAEQAGKKDEDHASAIFWNIVAIIQTKKDIKKGLLLKELDDFPFIIKDVFGEKNDIKWLSKIDFNDVVKINLEKFQDRKNRNVLKGSRDNRWWIK